MRFLTPREMTPDERLDALVEVLAEGIIYLGETGQLEGFADGNDAAGESGGRALTSGEAGFLRGAMGSGSDPCAGEPEEFQ